LKSSYTWEDAINMTEIKSLRKLNNHPNVIKILELIRKKEEISIVMEYCERELFKEMQNASKNNRPFSEGDIKIIMG
jgi:protein kinase